MSDDSDEKRLEFVAAPLVSAYFKILPQFEQNFPGATLTVGQGYRSPEMQNAAKLSGKSPFDGSKSFSKHQAFPARAIDVLVIQGGRIVDDGSDQRYLWLAQEFEAEGLVAGLRWHRPDPDHFEIPGPNPTAAQVEAGVAAFQRSPKTVTA